MSVVVPDRAAPKTDLTPRQAQILDGMARGLTSKAIGDELRIEENTAKVHARKLFRKLGAKDRAHAVAIGYETGLLGTRPAPEALEELRAALDQLAALTPARFMAAAGTLAEAHRRLHRFPRPDCGLCDAASAVRAHAEAARVAS